MIPYSPLPEIPFLFGLKLYPFGLLVATGVLMGYRFCIRQGKRLNIAEEDIDWVATAVVVTGFIGAHWIEAIFYQTDRLMAEGPIYLLKIWDGISSFGGFFGAIAGMLLFKRRVTGSVLPFIDITVNGLIIGWVFGRLGCTLAFDHPGSLTDFFLGFQVPGGARHNLGFYEFLYTVIVLVPTIFWLEKKNDGLGPRPGMYAVWMIAEYVPFRFFLDFFRAEDVAGADPRILGLTPGHYSALLLGVLGLGVYLTSRRLPENYAAQLKAGKVGVLKDKKKTKR